MKVTTRKFNKGEYLLRQNESSRHMFVINSGKVRVIREEGKHATFVNDVGPGATVGEISLIDGLPRSASAIALEEVEATVIVPTDMEDANQSCPAWFQALARSLAFRTRTALSNIQRNPKYFAEGSLVSLLIYFSIAAEKEKHFPKLEMVKKLSDILRIGFEEIEEFLQTLSQKELLQLDGDEIILESLEELEEYQKELREKLNHDSLETFRP